MKRALVFLATDTVVSWAFCWMSQTRADGIPKASPPSTGHSHLILGLSFSSQLQQPLWGSGLHLCQLLICTWCGSVSAHLLLSWPASASGSFAGFSDCSCQTSSCGGSRLGGEQPKLAGGPGSADLAALCEFPPWLCFRFCLSLGSPVTSSLFTGRLTVWCLICTGLWALQFYLCY